MVVEAEITILFQIVLYLNLIYLIQQQIKWFHGFLLVDKQWRYVDTQPPQNTDNIISFPIAFKTKCYLLIGVDSYGYNMLVLNNPTLNNFKAYGRGLDGNLSLSAVGGYGIFLGK